MRLGFIIAVLYAFTTACNPTTPTPAATSIAASLSGTSTPIPTATLAPTPTAFVTATPTLTPTPPPAFTLKVLSYNILYGAGVERQWDSALPPSLVGRSRAPELVAYIKQAAPQIIGLQEANGWERGTPPTIQQIAKELGMNYFLAKTPGTFHLGLLTKLEILEADNFAWELGAQGGLRATLQTPNKERLNVFVVHLEPNSADTRLCEVDTLVRQMQPYSQRPALLLGDMNFKSSSAEYARLVQAGWKPVAIEPNWGIDQIWIFPSARWSNTDWFRSLTTPTGISDHDPIGAEISIYPEPITLSTLTPEPIQTATATPIPSPFLSEAFTGVHVTRFESFDDPCALSRWKAQATTARLANQMLEITGTETWQTAASRYKEFFEGQGALVRFQFTGGSEFEIHFDNSAWITDAYRRWGLNLQTNTAQVTLWHGRTTPRGENLTNELVPRSGAWYNLLLAVGKNGQVIVQLRDIAEPSRVFKFNERMGADWVGMPWKFEIVANKGKVLLDDLTEFSFDQIKTK